jgi:hypothetical protein
MPFVELSAEELACALARRAELEPLGVRILQTIGAAPRVFRPEWLSEAEFRARLANPAAGGDERAPVAPVTGAGDGLDLGGEPYTRDELETAARLNANGTLSVRNVKKKTGIAGTKRASRLCSWFRAGALSWDREHERIRAAPGYRLRNVVDEDGPPAYRLERG